MTEITGNGRLRSTVSSGPTALTAGKEGAGKVSLQAMLPVPWRGLRSDLVLYPGPLEYDGQRSWVLEDPVRGTNFRLGYAEGEFLYRLATEPDLDAAVHALFRTTSLRPSLQEIVGFVQMLQRERLAVLPEELPPSESLTVETPGLPQQILRGQMSFRFTLLRPDSFLFRTLPWVSLLWNPILRWCYLLCGLVGLSLTLQDLDHYLSSVSYLFTPQGSLLFLLCLTLLKTGHEFAHAYAAKAMGLHVRSMGVLFIVVWPLLYTDTTDVWKIPDRRRRMWVAGAGILFELTVAGVALMIWSQLPDGVLRSLMFFLSGTSLISSVLVNLSPFMRYDGYYILMDYWGIDNLRSRSFAQLRYVLRRWLLDWQGPRPEIHPHRGAMAVFGFFSLLYRLFIGLAIAVAVYYLFFPWLGLGIFVVELWLFFVFPLYREIRMAVQLRRHWGAPYRLVLSAVLLAGLAALMVLPLPRLESVPCLFQYAAAFPVESPSAGEIVGRLPQEGQRVSKGDLLVRIRSDHLEQELLQVGFDLAGVRQSIQGLSGGGEQGAYRRWLIAEAKRLEAAQEKYRQAVAQLEIHSPTDGIMADLRPDLYSGAAVSRNAYLLTVADTTTPVVEAYVHERLNRRLKSRVDIRTTVRFADPDIPVLDARLTDRSTFPVVNLMNTSLLDVAGGPISSMHDHAGPRPRDTYFPYRFAVAGLPAPIPQGMPAWVWIRETGDPLLLSGAAWCWQKLLERGLF